MDFVPAGSEADPFGLATALLIGFAVGFLLMLIRMRK